MTTRLQPRRRRTCAYWPSSTSWPPLCWCSLRPRSGGLGLCAACRPPTHPSAQTMHSLLVAPHPPRVPQLPAWPQSPPPKLQAVFTNYGFHYPLTVALLQMAFISPVSYVVARPVLSWVLVRQLAPLAMVNVLNVVCGLIGAAAVRWRCRGRAGAGAAGQEDG